MVRTGPSQWGAEGEEGEGICLERSSAQSDFCSKAPLVMSGDTMCEWCMHMCMHKHMQRSEVNVGYLPLFLSTTSFFLRQGLSVNMEPTGLAGLADRPALEILLSSPVFITSLP